MSKPKTYSRRDAFTLADVVITALIIGILAAVSTPRLAGTFDQLNLDAAAKHVAADLRYARQLARTKGKNQSVTFTPDVDTYQLDGASAGESELAGADGGGPPHHRRLTQPINGSDRGHEPESAWNTVARINRH